MKRISLYIFTVAMLVFSNGLNAQDAGAAAAATPAPGVAPIFFDPVFYLLAIMFLIMLIAIIVLTRSLNTLLRNAYGLKQVEEGQKAKAAQTAQAGFWQEFDRNVLTRAVPIEKEKDIMFAHGYDGIHELDNDLPPWWKWGFYMTILFAFVYVAHYHVFNTGKSQREEYKQEVMEAENARQEMLAKNAGMVTFENVTALTEAGAIASGKDIYTKNCVACHGANGEGLVGPNLTDDYWIHGGGIKNIFKTVTNGVPAKGMISWKSQLSPKQIQEVASFLLTFHGTNPANGKEPQGDKWVDESAPATTDSTTAKDSTVVAVQDSLKK